MHAYAHTNTEKILCNQGQDCSDVSSKATTIPTEQISYIEMASRLGRESSNCQRPVISKKPESLAASALSPFPFTEKSVTQGETLSVPGNSPFIRHKTHTQYYIVTQTPRWLPNMLALRTFRGSLQRKEQKTSL